MLNEQQIKEVEFLVEQGYTVTQVSNLTNHGWGDYTALSRRYNYHKNKFRRALKGNKIASLEFELKVQKNKAKENHDKYKAMKERYNKKKERNAELYQDIQNRIDEKKQLQKEIKELKKQIKELSYVPKPVGRKPVHLEKQPEEKNNTFVYVVSSIGSKIAGCYQSSELALDKVNFEEKMQKRGFTYNKCYIRNS